MTEFLSCRPNLEVEDLGPAAAFLREVLGFEVEVDEPEMGLLLLRRDAVGLALVRSATPGVNSTTTAYIGVTGVDELHEQCAAHGARIVTGLADHPWGLRDFVVEMPGGHRLALGERIAQPRLPRLFAALHGRPLAGTIIARAASRSRKGGGVMDDGGRSLGFTQVSIPEGYDRFMLRQLFEPWAEELVARAGIGPGHHVLDLASGLGPVARLAAMAAAPGGRVVASDISAVMLAAAAARFVDPQWAPIDYLQCPAAAIAAPDDSFDVVLCQHGLQFFPERAAAAGEMRRVTRPGGIVVLSTWAAEHPLGLFGPMNETLRESALAEPFPRAFDPDSYRVNAVELQGLLQTAGLREVRVETVRLDAHWQTAEAAAATVLGTPFGPLVSALPADAQEEIRARLASMLSGSDGEVTVRTASNIAWGVK